MGGGVCKVIFLSNPTTVLSLCFVVVGAVTIFTDTDFFTDTNFTLFVLYMVCDSCTHQLSCQIKLPWLVFMKA